MSKPPRRHIKNWEEQDAYTKWRYLLISMSRPGVVRRIKQRTHRRERREGRNDIRKRMRDGD
jgi:hypothetical protein